MASVYKNEFDISFALMALPEGGDNEIEVIYIFIIHTNTPTQTRTDPTHPYTYGHDREGGLGPFIRGDGAPRRRGKGDRGAMHI